MINTSNESGNYYRIGISKEGMRKEAMIDMGKKVDDFLALVYISAMFDVSRSSKYSLSSLGISVLFQ